ncbi:hypothetical protein Q6348_09955 [Isoptericola sp. b441]|uniref:Uncharacterized protein n=1 Tax=Actinotalea lenta TaxID=3064654 RepID=A0ABT9DEJ8_9CELL|nr:MULTISPECIES: hypothetical protein [unclassified Isoptericola]MDO8107517.1 hypothetical protein [Isoptericola sp. b441]MDO8120823.1 hypothetical protein [Isoptericola sp. b490]
METHRPLPRSVLLALWLAQPPRTRSQARHAMAAIQGDDEPHVVEGLTPQPTGLDQLLTGLGELREVAAVLPVPGDLGVPPDVAALAADAGECVLALGEDGGWAVVPEIEEFGSLGDQGHLVTWRLRALPSGRRSLVGAFGTLGEAQADLRATLRQAVTALDDLDVARWRPEAAEALAQLRSAPGLTDLPPVDQRCLSTLLEAARLQMIVELATSDEGGAVNVWQADQRATALREVGRAARRAVAAATLAASQPSTDR